MASSRDTPRRACLTITRDHPSETISSLADLVQALDGLTVPCGWLSIVAQQALEPGEWLKLHQHLRAEGAEGSKARDRFYPWFGNELTASIPPITLASWNDFLGSREVIDPGDPLDIGLQYGLNAWFRNSLRQIGDKADDRVFAFAAVKRIQHESPILVETIITAASLGGVAFYRIVKAIYDLREARARARGGAGYPCQGGCSAVSRGERRAGSPAGASSNSSRGSQGRHIRGSARPIVQRGRVADGRHDCEGGYRGHLASGRLSAQRRG